MLEDEEHMVLILDGNSEHVAQVWRQNRSFLRKEFISSFQRNELNFLNGFTLFDTVEVASSLILFAFVLFLRTKVTYSHQ